MTAEEETVVEATEVEAMVVVATGVATGVAMAVVATAAVTGVAATAAVRADRAVARGNPACPSSYMSKGGPS